MKALLIAAVAFGLALALIVGLRLEEGSLAVLIGVLCGIAAGLPVSGALLYLLWRERQQARRVEEHNWQQHNVPTATTAPPVVILNSGQRPDLLPRGYALGPSQPRDFVIVGEEEMRKPG
ncbi:MAG: hypothetical protein JXA37_10745 [Chloroflexia bacterium]|nr:hypothetical protein [Chloroflexia bacterium]